MYLSIEQCEKLVPICSRFEVALRSYVAITMLNKAKIDEPTVRSTLTQISLNFKSNLAIFPVNTANYASKAKELLKSDVFSLLRNAKISFNQKDIVKGEVFTVGQLIFVIILFFNPTFIDLLSDNYDTQDQFVEQLHNYHRVRNSLAHPAYAKILKSDAEKVMNFINTLILKMDDNFWYKSKVIIGESISELFANINNKNEIKNNLEIVPKRHDYLILRESEMNELISLFFGISNYGRRSGAVEYNAPLCQDTRSQNVSYAPSCVFGL